MKVGLLIVLATLQLSLFAFTDSASIKKFTHEVCIGFLGNHINYTGPQYTLKYLYSKKVGIGINLGIGINPNRFNNNKFYIENSPIRVLKYNSNEMSYKIIRPFTNFLNIEISYGLKNHFITGQFGAVYVNGMYYFPSEGIIYNPQTLKIFENAPQRNYLKSIFFTSTIAYNYIIQELVSLKAGLTYHKHVYEFNKNELSFYKTSELVQPYQKDFETILKIIPFVSLGFKF